jgi:hypothetical protein
MGQSYLMYPDETTPYTVWSSMLTRQAPLQCKITESDYATPHTPLGDGIVARGIRNHHRVPERYCLPIVGYTAISHVRRHRTDSV